MFTPKVDLTRGVIEHPGNSEDGRWKVSWPVGGESVWFSSETELALRPESIVCAFLLHQMAKKAELSGDVSIDPVFADNLPKIAAVAKAYWGFDRSLPSFPTAADIDAPNPKSAMFFTGGIDSFFTLKRNQGEISTLINVHGFDIKLDDEARFEASADGIRDVADMLGIDAVFVSTNLKQSRTFNSVNWLKTHGAALAAIAQLLPGTAGVVRVASSDVAPPHGSHPDLDNLWTSGAVRLLNDEINISRFDKVKEIVHWAPAQKHLKVCWQNLSADLNCGRCEKCLRSQVAIKAAGGDLSLFRTFPERDLAEAIDNLPRAAPHLWDQWRRLIEALEDGKLVTSIENLLHRSTIPPQKKRLSTRIKRRVRRLLGRA